MLIYDLHWAEGGRSLPSSSIARRLLTTTSLWEWSRCPEPLLACGLLGCHGAWRQPQASAHIPSSNPAFKPELWSQDSGNVSGRPGTAPQVYGGRYVPSQNWGSDSFYCTHVSTIKRRPWLDTLWNLTLLWGHTYVIRLRSTREAMLYAGQHSSGKRRTEDWHSVRDASLRVCSSMTSTCASLENFHHKKITVGPFLWD